MLCSHKQIVRQMRTTKVRFHRVRMREKVKNAKDGFAGWRGFSSPAKMKRSGGVVSKKSHVLSTYYTIPSVYMILI